MGTSRGLLGVCGNESRHFCAIPWLARGLQDGRPDLTIHSLVENAGSTLPHQHTCMRNARAIPPEQH
eukprot:5820375-Prorocentrum_lima.AAC.1